MHIANTRKGDQTRERIMQAIISYIEKHQYAPTVRELLEMTGIKSTSTMHRHISVLINAGRLETDAEWGTPRALRVPGYRFIREGDNHG